MTKDKFLGVTIIRSRKKLGIRFRHQVGKEKFFDKSFTLKDLFTDNPKDHEKVEKIIDEAIIQTKWVPSDGNSMIRLFKFLAEKHGVFKDLHNKYEHIKSSNLYDIPDKKVSTNIKDPILTELRLIRNYLEKLTLLQEAKEEVEK